MNSNQKSGAAQSGAAVSGVPRRTASPRRAGEAKRTKSVAKLTKKSDRAKNDGRGKVKKDKLVRDSFTIPESEYSVIAAIKKRCLAKGMAVKKSEVLRAAIISFAALSDAAVTKALKGVEVLKTGRPPSTRKQG